MPHQKKKNVKTKKVERARITEKAPHFILNVLLKPYIMLIITHFWHNRINFNPSTRIYIQHMTIQANRIARPVSKQTERLIQINQFFFFLFESNSNTPLCLTSIHEKWNKKNATTTHTYKYKTVTWNSTSVLMIPNVCVCVRMWCHAYSIAWHFFFVIRFISNFHSISINVNCKLALCRLSFMLLAFYYFAVKLKYESDIDPKLYHMMAVFLLLP